MNRRVIVFGNDHTNTLGVIQSLASEGISVLPLLFGDRTGIVKASKYVQRIESASDADACVKRLLKLNVSERTPIIACCDSAALSIDKAKDNLTALGYVFEHSTIHHSLFPYFEKDIQVGLAKDSGLNVPLSVKVDKIEDIPEEFVYPCLIKPLVSCHGGKGNIKICKNHDELLSNYKNLKDTPQVILQQYIERDYEVSILGCGTSDGHCIIPAVENKLTLYPKYVGLECLAEVVELEDEEIIAGITKLVKAIGYVGVFSVEMMHSKTDGRYYFTEINLRNDGAQSFIYKYGVNLPLLHVQDLLGEEFTIPTEFRPGYYIWDMHHFKSLLCRDISIKQWWNELRKSKGLLMYSKEDIKPFFRQYLYLLLKALKRKRTTKY